MDELSLYFSTENETSKPNLSEKSTRSASRPTSFHNGSQQRKSFRGYNKKNKTMDADQNSAHSSFLNLNPVSNNQILSCGSVSTRMPHILPPEIEEGNIEYKRKLVDPTPNRFEQLVTQMKWRLNEGGGKAIYKLGVDDDGHISGLRPSELISSLTTLERMARRLNATLHPLRERVIESTTISSDKECRKAVEMLVRLAPTTNEGSPDLCVALVGGMDSGKSTLIGVLTDGELDNARGKARLNLFRHLHEVQSGRTSSLSRELLGFDINGNVTNYKYADGRVYRRSAEEVVRMSSNLLTLLDLAGHSKYQRTTLAGIACNQPLMGILVISATIGLSTIGLDHIQLLRSLSLPMIVVLTKIDQLSNGTEQMKRIQLIYRQLVYQFKQIENAWSYGGVSSSFSTWRLNECSFINHWKFNSFKDLNDEHCMPPFFPVSSVTGQGIENLMHFLSRLSRLNHHSLIPLTNSSFNQCTNSQTFTTHQLSSSQEEQQNIEQHSFEFMEFSNETLIQLMLIKINEQMNIIKTYQDYNGTLFWINQVYTQIPGVCNPVIVGRVQFGQLLNNQILWLGPDYFGDFYPVQIVSLMHNRQVHDIVYAGQSASMEVYFLPKTWNTMTQKQRQNILQSISSSAAAATTTGAASVPSSSSFVFFGDNNITTTTTNNNNNNNDITGNEENIPCNEPGNNLSSIYQFYSPIKIRRGMILLTYPMLLTTLSSSMHSLPPPPSPPLPSSPSLPSPVTSSYKFIWNERLKPSDHLHFTVVWTVKLKLIRRLPIVSFKLGNPPVILTPIPSIGQRVSIYAGCICQTGVILEIIQQCKHEEDKEGCVNNQNHLDDTTYIVLRFIRHPELLEIGRQFILTWNGNLKTVGYAVELIDPLNQYNTSLITALSNNTTDNTTHHSNYSSNNIHILNKIDHTYWINHQNTVSLQEKDDYDWSTLRQSFINRTITRMNSSSCDIDKYSSQILSSSFPSSCIETHINYALNDEKQLKIISDSSILNLTALTELDVDCQNDDNGDNKNKDDSELSNVNTWLNVTNNLDSIQSVIDDINVSNATMSTPPSVSVLGASSASSNKRRRRRKHKR